MGDELIVDPTKNVLTYVEAAVTRLDDLREAESRRVNEQIVLRAEFAKQLNEAEAKRIDAIRAVDVNAVSVATERATAQAAVLQNQVNQSAETLRSLVESKASTLATQTAQVTGQISDRLTIVEKAQNVTSGAKDISTPMLATVIGAIAAIGASILTFLITRALH